MEKTMMLVGESMYISEIPAEFMQREKIEYYLLLELSQQREITFPSVDAKHNPIVISIDVSKDKSQEKQSKDFDIIGLTPKAVIISPQPGERVRKSDFIIALSYFGEKNIDPEKVRIYLDGLNVTEITHIDSTYLSMLSKSITPGVHTVNVNMTNKYDQKYNDIIWSFTVLPNDINESGVIRKQSARMLTNYIGGSVDKYPLNIAELNLDYETDIDWLHFKTQFIKSTLDSKYEQPRNRYYFYFKNKIMNIKLGDSYPSLDQYALNGHHVRGVNFNFRLGLLSLNIINGNSAQVIQGNPSNGAIEAIIDTNNWNVSLSRNNYTFQQEVLAGKIGFQLGKKFYWDFNCVKVGDNISTVTKEITNAEIDIITREGIDTTVSYENLLIDYNNYFGEGSSLEALPDKNWIGAKPLDNFIYGSNLGFNFDNSRIQMNSGFSISFLNRNKWNTLESISELDILAFDTSDDGYFLDYYQLDTTINLPNNENQFSFGTNQLPLLPFMFNKNINIINILNMSNLNRYIKLRLRYFGHKIELVNRRNGPDYYSILNPFLKTNYSESYMSDNMNLFENKLLVYFKWSKINEGIYSVLTSPLEKRKSLFNISLLPGVDLPTFNFGFSSLNCSNYENKIIDEIIYLNPDDNQNDTITFVRREETASNLMNISMSHQFQKWWEQVISINILLFDLKDKVAGDVNEDTLKSIGYLPKDASSESYGINLKTIYNKYWESTIYFGISYYDFGRKEFIHYQKRNLYNIQIDVNHYPLRYITKLKYGFQYSTGDGNKEENYITQYSFKIGAEAEPLEKFIFSLFLDYRIKNAGTYNRSFNDFFIRTQLRYDIL